MNHVAVVMIAIVVFIFHCAIWVFGKQSRDVQAEQDARNLGLDFVGDDKALGSELSELVGVWWGARAEQVVAQGGVRYGTLTWTTTYSTGNAATTAAHRSAFMVYAVRAELPVTRIRLKRLFSLPFNENINTEDEEFNRWWDVTSDDEAFALALLTPQVRGWVNTMPFKQLHLGPGRIIGYDAGRYDPQHFATLRDSLSDFIALIPAELLNR